MRPGRAIRARPWSGRSHVPTNRISAGWNALFVNNVELRFPFIGENIQGVIFHDLGNVYSSVGDMSFRFHQRNLQDFNYAVQDVGFGLRYKTPVGPVRADFAYGINPPSFVGFKGDTRSITGLQSELASGRRLPGRTAKHQPFPILLFHRTDVLTMYCPMLFPMLASASQGGVVIDRIAVIVGRHVHQNQRYRSGSAIDGVSESRTDSISAPQPSAKSAERLIDQEIIRQEIVTGGYRRPSGRPKPRRLKSNLKTIDSTAPWHNCAPHSPNTALRRRYFENSSCGSSRCCDSSINDFAPACW